MNPEEANEVENDTSQFRNAYAPTGAKYGWGAPTAPPAPPYSVPAYPPPGGVSDTYFPPPPSHGGGSGGSMYPNIGFNPGLFVPPPSMGRQMECPICKQFLSPPIYQCQSGHTICNRCIERLDYCISQPDCMNPLEGERIRNFALEQACSGYNYNYPVPCPNHGDGCLVVLPSDQLAGHVEVCDFRGYHFCSKYFGWTNCYEKVKRFSLLDHIRDYHHVQEIDQDRFTLKLIASSHLMQATPLSSPSGVVWAPLLIKSAHLDDAILLKCFVSPRGSLTLAGYLLGTNSDLEWKKYRIKFQLNSTSKVARLEWTGRLIFQPLNEPHNMHAPGEDVSNNVNTFRIPLHSLQEYIKPAQQEEEPSSSKIKIKVCVWKHTDEIAPFRDCFINSETGQEEEPQEKLTLFGKFPGEADSNAFVLTAVEAEEQTDHYYHNSMSARTTVQYNEEEYAKYYSPEASCSHCSRPLYGDVIYQCLQCPSEAIATYFCRTCIEVGNHHADHLTIRISKPDLQPWAAVAFECAAGELH